MKLKSLAVGLAALTVATVVPVSTVFAGYSPANRDTYTCITPTNCPGADHVVFNSFVNNPNYGDERPFLDARDAGVNTEGGWLDSMKLQDGQKITVRAFIHNNANPAAIGEEAATAKNTKLQLLLPKGAHTTTNASANISADNASPNPVSDTVDLTGDRPFTIVFDKGPVNLTHRPGGTGDQVTEAMNTSKYSFDGDNVLNVNFGNMRGCFEFAVLVSTTATVKMEKPPTTPPPTTPPTPPRAPAPAAAPTSLPKTGPGDVAAVAAVVATAAGTILYRRRLSRSLSE